jgi:hypothetical protein
MPKTTAYPGIEEDYPDLANIPTDNELLITAGGKDYNITLAQIAAALGDTSGGDDDDGGITELVTDLTPQLGGNLDLNGFTAGTATTADLNKLHSVTVTAVEINRLVGITSAVQGQLDLKAPSAHTHTAFQIADSTTVGRAVMTAATQQAGRDALGITLGETGLLNVEDDTSPTLGGNLDLSTFTVGTATATDLTKLHALTPTAIELNYVDGVTSAIQTQLDAKSTIGHGHSSTEISDSTSFGRDILTAESAEEQRTAMGVPALIHSHPASDISDSTSIGRAVMTAADAATAQAAIATISDADARLTDRRKPLVLSSVDVPTVDDDTTAGYADGDLRIVNNDAAYLLFDAAEGVADWRQTGLTDEQQTALENLDGFLTTTDVLPPYEDVAHNVATFNLDMDDHLAIVTSTDASAEFTIRAQADFAWAASVLINFDCDNDYKVIAATGVSINGFSASTWTGQSNPSGATLRKVGTNSWRLQGDVVKD